MDVATMIRSKGTEFNMCHGFQPVYFNTGTIYDYEGGRLSMGVDNKYLIGGGFGNFITAIQGKNNVFKSTTVLSLLIRVLEIYPDSNLIIVDTEGSIISDLSRLVRFSIGKQAEILKRIHPIDGKAYTAAEILRTMKNLCEEREKLQGKDLWVETPFANTETGAPLMTRKPLLCLIDSLSKLNIGEVQDLIESEGLDGGKTQTAYMVGGFRKGLFMDQLSTMSSRYGISFITSAWLSGTIEINSHQKQGKQFTESRQGERTKGTSVSYDFLTHIAYQVMSSSVYWADKDKRTESKYPYDDFTLPKDLHQVSIKFVRSKVNMSGNEITELVISQRDGLQSELTNFDYLKANGCFGLDPAKPGASHYAFAFQPDKKYTRRTVRKAMCDNYEIARGAEICMQLHYVQTYWRHFVQERYPNTYTPEELYNKFSAKESSIKVQDILNSRGVWTYDKGNKRPFMNIFHILDLMGKK